MRKRVVPMLASMAVERQGPVRTIETSIRGVALLASPPLNKGAAFTAAERSALGLTGFLPPHLSTLAAQVRRAWIQYERLLDPLRKNAFLMSLYDRNEVLFYRLLSEHLREMIPVLSDVTVAAALDHQHHDCRRPRGVYLSIDHPGAIEETFANVAASTTGIDLVLATDGEHIPGVGDRGIDGIEELTGKLAVYTAAGGINPARVLAVMLDVGTNSDSLAADPTYLGNTHRRIGGERYLSFIDDFVSVVSRLFPGAMLQWSGLSPLHTRTLLDHYSDRICTFNDGTQGTGAIALAAAVSAVRVCGIPLRNHRIVIAGADSAGIGIADQLCSAMVLEGLPREKALKRFWIVDQAGLLVTDMADALHEHQARYARPGRECKTWRRESGRISLAEVVRRASPTMLIGTSGAFATFTEPIVREMAAHTERPIVFALSSPAACAEACPADLITWTDGRGLIATGSPFAPVTWRGVTYVVAQVSNAMLYPGLALGVTVSRATRISNGMLAAAASAVSSLVAVRHPGASLLPHIDDLHTVSMTVAVAVAEAAEAEGLATQVLDDVAEQVRAAMWQPEYGRIECV